MSFFAGVANFMEDEATSTEVDVNVVVESENAAEEAEAVVEAADDVENAVDQAEMALGDLDRADRLSTYISQYGVNRHFLELVDHDKSFSTQLKLAIPSTENFSEIGSPSSEYSVAALEGLKEMAGKAWDFIKRIAQSVMKAVRNFVTTVMTRINSYETTVKRFDEAFGKAKWDDEKVKNKTATLVSAAAVTKLAGVLKAAASSQSAIIAIAGGTAEPDVEKAQQHLDKFNAAIKKDSELTAKEGKISTLWPASERDRITAGIKTAIAEIRQAKDEAAKLEASAKSLEAAAASNAKMSSDAEAAKKDLEKARKQAKIMSMGSSSLVRYTSAWAKVASYNARAGAAWLTCRA